MRTGNNPEKEKLKKIPYYNHRIIIPVYIPNSEDSYFNELFDVFKLSLNSLLNTIIPDFTKITIINNNCKLEVTNYIQSLLNKKKIDKHIVFSQNYGKVYPILQEVKMISEPYVTIADADVYYFNNWIEETIKIFNRNSKAGVVCPSTSIKFTSYNNYSLFFDKIFRIKKGKIVENSTIEYVIRGLKNENIDKELSLAKEKKQFFFTKENTDICVGAGHFVATYKTELFKKIKLYNVKYVFKGGDENNAFDAPIDSLGYYRLSTINSYVYHIGNKIDSWIKEKDKNLKLLKNKDHYIFPEYRIKKQNRCIFVFKKIISRFYVKMIRP